MFRSLIRDRVSYKPKDIYKWGYSEQTNFSQKCKNAKISSISELLSFYRALLALVLLIFYTTFLYVSKGCLLPRVEIWDWFKDISMGTQIRDIFLKISKINDLRAFGQLCICFFKSLLRTQLWFILIVNLILSIKSFW